MDSIGIIQIGLKRDFEVARKNHEMLYTILNSKYNINIYDFYRTEPIPECPFQDGGRIQLYDFFSCTGKIPDNIILKIRSDIYLTKSSIEVLCREIDNILNNKLDICYLGLAFGWYPDKVYHKEKADLQDKVPDSIILARKDKLVDNWLDHIYKNVYEGMSGNRAYLKIKKDTAVAYMVSCQIYILKWKIAEEDNWSLYYKSMGVEGWRRKASKEVDWVRDNKDIINKF